MLFEKFLLDNYIATEEGMKILSLFKNIYPVIDEGDKDGELTNFINSLLFSPIASEFFPFDVNKEPIAIGELEYPPFSEFEEWVYKYFENIKEDWKCSDRELLGEIPQLSVKELFRLAPVYAFPYLYPVHFNVVQSIFHEFNIPLPPLPSQRKHKERCLYYIEICRSLFEFRQHYGISPEELCVFMYGFAPKFVRNNIKKNLPQPSNVWIVGANTYDSTVRLSDICQDTVLFWQGNPAMNAGDIVFIYELAPYKVIRYVWIAISDGYDDPFQFYPGKVWLGNPVKIPDITFADLKENPYLSKHGLVRAHMQGLGRGVALKFGDYKSLCALISKRGFDVTVLPELLCCHLDIEAEINDEKDVEQYLLEPFLAKLGVQQKHITRQMPLRMGRGVRYYPDYVINAKTTRGEERGSFVWEAKYRISSNKKMLEDFYQAKSYARRLDANGLGLVSYEGIWLSFAADHYNTSDIEHFTWHDLQNPDIFSCIATKLKKII